MPADPRTSTAPRDTWLFGLLAVGLLLRVGLILVGIRQPAARWEYDVLVQNLLDGRGLVYEHIASVPYRAYYSGLPWLGSLLLCRALTNADLPVQLWQASLSCLTAACAFDLARALAGRRAGLAAAASSLFHPGLLYYDVAQIHPLALDTALGLASLAVLRRALDSRAVAWSATLGLVLGLAVLQRSTLLPFALGAPLLLWRHGQPRGARLAWALCGLTLAPWLVRNVLVLGSPVLTTTSAEHFWVGNAAVSTGGNLAPDGRPVLASLPAEEAHTLAGSDELGQARIFARLGCARVSGDPASFARGVALKLARFWTLAPHTGLLYPPAWTWLHLGFYLPLLLLGLRGAWRRRSEPLVIAALGLCSSVSLAHALFYFEFRHRLALEPVLAVLACAGSSMVRPRFDLAGRGCK